MATRRRGFGFRLLDSVLLVVALCVVLPRGESGVFAQSQPQSNYADLLKAKQKRFFEYEQDFIDFAKAVSSPQDIGQQIEYEVAFNLQSVSDQTSDQLHAQITLLQIYNALSCKEDRPIVREFIERDFHFYSREMELAIEYVNREIAITKSPGVAAEAARMRDDLREVRRTLDSVKLQ